MKIAITGTHGVGKTTLAKKLADVYKLPLLTETAREVAAELGYANTTEMRTAGLDEIAEFQRRVLQGQITKEALASKFVSDRTVLDMYAYSTLYGLDWEHHFSWIMGYASARYSAIIYAPIPGGGIHDDGFRLTDPESQQEIDKMVLHMAKQLECPLIELSRNRDNWYKEALHGIEVVRRDKRKRVKNALIGDDGDGK